MNRNVNINRNLTANRNANVNRNVNVNRNANRNANRNVNVNRNVSSNVNRNVNANRTYAYRNGKRGFWRNGVWIAAPIAAGAVGYVATCAYEYNQWQSTGSAYWRDRYNKCAN